MAGDLRERIQLREFVATGTDALLAPTGIWRDKGAPVRAAKRDLSDRERAAVDAWRQTTLARFTLRASAFSRTISREDRILHRGVEWAIVGITAIGDGTAWLQLTCETGDLP
ncbi:head-tail adaptor protein [Mangrovicoccus algicola]|uniref:Head-tail adaptor protein n=1 Tax=Mangrovicoccus algicola TaxID=2771008 RepID=A0A8J7CZ75_9RHOB|nr:head-tail adaptor protein [Mangrovicoccus algicola]MBE3637468.1 head-tail adaptor protein [Mangrovicoccus algicola]